MGQSPVVGSRWLRSIGPRLQLRRAGWRKGAVAALLAACAWAGCAGSAAAKGDYADLKPIPVIVTLGDKENRLLFAPNRLRFETGKLYKLFLVNASPQKHEFVATELSDAVFTVKVEIISPQGEEIAEIGGIIREIEVAPDTTVEWYFIPLRTVKEAPFICDLPGHLTGGMKGLLTIE